MAVVDVTVGAVKRPSAVTVPAAADHVTSESSVLETTAANCFDKPEEMFALAGETTTCTGADATGERFTLIEIILSPCASPELSATVSMKLYDPAILGVPEIDPETELMISPGGIRPARLAKW
jgi:hypothetical protein